MLNALIGLVALTAVFLAGYVCSKRIMLGWYCFLVASAISAFFGSNQADVAGFHIDPSDLVNMVLLVAGSLRFFRRGAMPGNMRLVSILFLAIFAFSVARGISANGIFVMGIEGRTFLNEVLSMLFFFTFPADDETIRKVVTAYIWYGVALMFCAALHYAGLQVGDASSFVDTEERDRALTVAGSASLSTCLIFSLAWSTYRKSSWHIRIMPALSGGLVVLLQHRTVWNMLLGCALLMLFLDVKLLRRFAPTALIAGSVTLLIGLAVYGSGQGALDTLEGSATNSGTWDFRVLQWKGMLFDEPRTPLTFLFGEPMGTPYSVYIDPNFGYSGIGPHSEYVALYMRMGLAGCVLFVSFLLYPIFVLYRRARQDSPGDFPSSSSWSLVIFSMVIYGVTYHIDSSFGVLLGFANALARTPTWHQTQEEVVQALIEDSTCEA